MSKRMYCNQCGAYVGECGHEPGVTDSVTLSGTCGKCGRSFSVTCNGDCLARKGGGEDTTTVWECTCAKCGFTWTDNEDNTSCPDCGSDEGMCVAHDIPSTPVMPGD